MVRPKRRRLLQLAAGGIVGTSRWLSGEAGANVSDGPSSGEQPSGDPGDFDPAAHGFGFSNWAEEIGEDVDGEEFTYESGEVTQRDVRRAIDDSWTTELSESRMALMTRIVYSWIGSNAATNGHCYGMVFSAATYFQTPSELPACVGSASEIPRPTDEYDTVGDRIRRFQTSQLLRTESYWFAFLGLRWGLADHSESLRHLTEAIDATGVGGLMLDGEGVTHQVLAHDYERSNGVTDVFVYDPNYRAVEQQTSDGIWKLSVVRESGEILQIKDGYDEFLYHNPEMDVSVVDDLIGHRDRVLNTLSNAVFLGLETGETVEVEVPDDALVDRPAAEYANSDRKPYSDSVFVLGSLEEFEISIVGEGESEYSLEIFGLRDGDLALEERVSGTLEAEPVRLRYTINEAGKLVVEAVEEGVAEAGAEAAEEIEDAVEERAETDAEEANDETNWLEDNWLIATIGSALGIGTAYRFLAHRSDTEAET